MSEIDKINNKFKRISLRITGAIQGVGFRPFVYNLASELELKGNVKNTSKGVVIDIEGEEEDLNAFIRRVQSQNPVNSVIKNIEFNNLEACGYKDFKIEQSERGDVKSATVLPDIATCGECLREIFDESDRRFLYPFTNCTQCGPRFSIIETVPYDRANTTMKSFSMCDQCQNEFDEPDDRRFHAQPNACCICGPEVQLWDKEGQVLATKIDAIVQAATMIKEGKTLAVKGLGGFHFVCDAENEEAVQLLRQRKNREEKPFAVMFKTIESLEKSCQISDFEKELISSSAAPIVLVKKKGGMEISDGVAPNNPYLGAMLPYTPLHHILMRELGGPVVVTSGNLSDEPICIDEQEALTRLKDITDVFLVHNRPIVRPVDDSVVKVMMDKMMVLRRARGFAPLPVSVTDNGSSVLGLGAHLKNTVALKINDDVFLSQHLGDLETPQSVEAFDQAVMSFKNLYEPSIDKIACDQHPDYYSTKKAYEQNIPVVPIQHHHAHIVSCMAEHNLDKKVLGIAWDGTGVGPDKTVWGGEFLICDRKEYERKAHLRTFCLPGGDKAAVEPRRAALAILWELGVTPKNQASALPTFKAFSEKELGVVTQMLEKGINAPRTSSAGRLFDAVASLLNIKQVLQFEGQAAMQLEYLCEGRLCDDRYSFTINEDAEAWVIDWKEMFEGIIADIQDKCTNNIIAVKFHNTLVEMAVEVAKGVGSCDVVLSGGCFQNKYLTERLITRLKYEDFIPYWHSQVPPNDGGIALGQVVAAA